MANKFDEKLFEDKKFDDKLFEDKKYDEALFDDTEVDTEPTQLESLIRGGAQGATFDLADEALGAAKAAGKTVFGGDKYKDVVDTYKRERDIERAKFAAAQEANPMTYLAGDIAGGILPAIATGGAGAVASVGKVGLKEAAKAGAKAGAKYGAMSGLGRSEAEILDGDIRGTAADVATGAAGGAVLGGAIPVAIKGAKATAKAIPKAMKDITKWVADTTGDLGNVITEAGKMTRGGDTIISKKAYSATTKELEDTARTLNKTISEITQPKASKKITDAMEPDVKIDLTDTLDGFIKKLDDNLESLIPDSQEAKVLGNIKAKFTKIKANLLKDAGQDPNLPTKSEVYQKLLQKKADLDAIANTGIYEAKSIDNLFNKVAKMKRGWSPQSMDAERIQKDFNLADRDSAIQMLKDVAKLKISRPKVDKETGEITEQLFELRDVIKRYEPKIIEQEGRVMLQRGPGVIRESESLRYRPDALPQSVKLAPQEVLNLQKDVRDLTIGQPGLTKKIGAEISEELTGQLKSGISKTGKKSFDEGMQIYRDIYALEDIVPGISKVADTGDADKVVNSLQTFLTTQLEGLDPGQQRALIDGFSKRIVRSVPELGKQFLDKTAHLAKLSGLQEKAYRSGTVRVTGPIESLGVKVGAGVGTTVRWTDKLTSAGKDEIARLAEYSVKKHPQLSTFLENLSKVDSPSRRKALIFSASQKPDLRDSIKDLLGSDEE